MSALEGKLPLARRAWRFDCHAYVLVLIAPSESPRKPSAYEKQTHNLIRLKGN